MLACPTKLVDEGMHYLWDSLGEDEKGPGPRRTPARLVMGAPINLASSRASQATLLVARLSCRIHRASSLAARV
jgi:hypothetical protein